MIKIPIIKKDRKKDGKQQYIVRIFYEDQFGNKKAKDKTVYGKQEAQLAEIELKETINKQKNQKNNITLNDLFNEYCDIHQFEVRESTLYDLQKFMRLYVLADLGKIRLNKLNVIY